MKVILLDYQSLMFFFSLLNIRKRNKQSHRKRKNRNLKRKNRYSLTLSDLSIISKQSGHHIALSRLVTLSICSLRNLDIGASKFDDRAHRLHDAAIILTRCYTQHAFWPYIDSEINHIGILSKFNLSIKELNSLTNRVYLKINL